MPRFGVGIQCSCMFTAPTPLPDDAAALRLIVHAALAEIARLQGLIAGLQRHRFGRRSERLDDAEVRRRLEALQQSVAEQSARVEAAARDTPRPNHPNAIAVRCRRICRGSR